MTCIFFDKGDYEIQPWFKDIFQNTKFQFTTSLEKENTISFISNLNLSERFADPKEKAKLIDTYCSQSKTVFVIITEINPEIIQLISLVKNTNVQWMIPGFVQGLTNTIHYGWHIKNTISVFNCHPPELDPYSVKPMYFDALLGTNKSHRNYLYSQLMSNGLADKIVLKYHGKLNKESLVDNDEFIWDAHSHPFPEQHILHADGTKHIKQGIARSTENVEYFGQSVRLSQIIPELVYNQSAYSIITESFFDNNFTFFTEKIAKALLGRRLFVVFSGHRYLENLRRLGFRTFDNVIDESYDLVEDNSKRFSMAFEQIKWLANQDQSNVLPQIKDICEHNYNLLMSGALYNDMINNIRKHCE